MRTALFGDDLGKRHLALHQLLYQLIVLHPAGHVNLLILRVLGRGRDPLVTDLHLGELAFVHHLDKGIIRQVRDLGLEHGREHRRVQEHQHYQSQYVVIIKRPPAVIVVVIHKLIHLAKECYQKKPAV